MDSERLLEELARLNAERAPQDQVLKLKEELVEVNVGLVTAIAKKFVHSGEPLQDLIQAGYIGLLNAVHNFDLNRGTKFSTYATYLIQGEVRHHIRDKNTTIRLPQWLQKLSHQVKVAQEAFYQEHGRLPTIAQLSDALNIEEEGVREALKAREALHYVSIDAERREDDPRPASFDQSKIRSKHPDDFPIEYRIKIASAIESLTELQQQVINDLFYAGKSQAQVGEEVGYSQRHISRIKQEVLDAIRDKWDEPE